MSIDNLFPPFAADLPLWQKFIKSVDEIRKVTFDDQLKILLSLRDNSTFIDPTDDSPIRYEQEFLEFIEGSTNKYQSKKVKFIGTNFKVWRQNLTLAPPFDLELLTLGVDYTVSAENKIVYLGAPLSANSRLRAVFYDKSYRDVDNVFNYVENEQVAEIATGNAPVAQNTIDIFNSTNVLTGQPANIYSGYPYNLIVVYAWNAVANEFTYVPFGNVVALPDGISLQIQTDYVTDKFFIFARTPSQELTRKLRQLGFLYPDMEYVTRPTYVDNSHILQLMSDSFGKYLKETAGTPNFMNFYQYCANTMIKIERLWAQDKPGTIVNPIPDDDTYGDFVSEADVLADPISFPKMHEIGENNAGWYPTSHVNLIYDLFLFGSNLDYAAIENFFNYVAPENLVLANIILQVSTQSGPSSTISIFTTAQVDQFY
ncbi:MAG: hypothetical protein WC967_09290 [Balneolaceae bacterium]